MRSIVLGEGQMDARAKLDVLRRRGFPPSVGARCSGPPSHVRRSMRVRLGSLAYGVQLKEPNVIAGKQLPMKLSANEPVQASSVAPEIGSV
jgi:hypothetical protein